MIVLWVDRKGVINVKVLFLQEYVRESHMRQNNEGGFDNVFFSTKGGELLKKLVEGGLGLKKADYYIDYAFNLVPDVIQRDKSGRAIKYKPPTQAEIKAEEVYLRGRILAEKPDIIIPTGNIGCRNLLNQSAITRLRGVPEKVTVEIGEADNPPTEEELTAHAETRANLITKVERAESELASHDNAYPNKHVREKDRIKKTIVDAQVELAELGQLTTAKESHEVWVLPMHSMEYMLVNPNIQNLIEADLVTLQKFVEQGEKAFQASPVDYNFVETIEEVRRIFTEDVPNAPIVSWDLETNSLSPEYEGSKILVISIATKEGAGNTIPLEHKDFTWKPEELEEIYGLIKDFQANPDIVKVGHNLAFDIRFLRLTQGFTTFLNNRDTKVMYYLLINQEVEGSLQLSDLAYELTDMGGYDKSLDDFKRDYIAEYRANERKAIDELRAQHREKVKIDRAHAKAQGQKYVTEKRKFPTVNGPINEIDGGNFNYEWIPLKSDLHPYASGDVDAGLRIHNQLDAIGKKPENVELRKLYTKHYTELVNYLAKLEVNGIKMNTGYTEDLAERYLEEEERLEMEMSKFPEVKQLEAEHQKLYERGLQEWAIPKKDRDLEVAKLRDRYKNKLAFNPNSPDDKKKILYKIPNINLPFNKEYLVDSATENNVPEEEINWSHYKTDKTALEYIRDHFEDQSELADILLTHSLVKTRRSGFTYKLRDMVDDNGVLHGGFNPTGTGCVTGDTLLVTEEGIAEIQSLSSNREEGTFSDINLNIHSHNKVEKADGFYYSGTREGKEVTLVDGTEITATNNHPLLKHMYLSQREHFNKRNKVFKNHLQNTQWEKAENVLEGDYIAMKVGTHLYGNKIDIDWNEEDYTHTPTSHTKHATLPKEVTVELAEWLGMYMADGNITKSNGSSCVVLTNSDEEVLGRFTELTKSVFNLDVSKTNSKNRSPDVSMSSKYVGSWVQNELGVNTGSLNKDVPQVVLQGTKEVQQAFIRGLTLDSSVRKKEYPSLYFSAVSPRMMDKVRAMLLNMGIYASLAYRLPYADNYHLIKEVIVTYQESSKFLNSIGFVESSKAEILRDKLETSKGSLGRRMGIVIAEDYVFVKVKTVESVKEEFFDLHVPESHSYIGNGVVNHNTGRLSAQRPNLQQIPASTSNPHRFDYKNPIKRMFVTRFEGGALLEADYSALESRLLALAAGDEEMTETFLNNGDIHSETAALVFSMPVENVTSDLRESAKATTFGGINATLHREV